MKFSFNVGGLDRVSRLILGVVLIALAYFDVLTGTLAIIAYIVAVIALATGVIRLCPINAALGINTCKAKPSETTE